MSGMLFLVFMQSLFQFGAKEGIWEGYYGDKNYLDMFFVANVVIQIAQPQVCYPTTKQDMLDFKSSMCRKKNFKCSQKLLKCWHHWERPVWINRVSQRPCPPKPFQFASTKINSSLKTTSKPSITLKSTSPPSNFTKAVPKQPKSSK